MFILMVAALVVLAFFHLYIFSRLAFGAQKAEPDRELPVSVVICARNESSSLQELIPRLMEQDHRNFEVVVVNDRSDDDSREVLQYLRKQYPNLNPVNIQADGQHDYGKKIALGVGVRSAKHPHLLVTDADCMPTGRDWIALMASGFKNNRRIVIGHSPYERKRGIANLLERYDGYAKAVQYISFAQAGLPYMGVGRNMGFASDLYFSAIGMRRHTHLMSGDDDLFVNEVARKGNTAVVVAPGAFTVTRATPGLATWLRRKRRHYTTAAYYRTGHQVLLTLLPFARMVLWATIIFLLFKGQHHAALVGLGIELAIFMPITMRAMHRLGAGALVWFALPLEWLFLFLDPCIYISTIIFKPQRWK